MLEGIQLNQRLRKLGADANSWKATQNSYPIYEIHLIHERRARPSHLGVGVVSIDNITRPFVSDLLLQGMLAAGVNRESDFVGVSYPLVELTTGNCGDQPESRITRRTILEMDFQTAVRITALTALMEGIPEDSLTLLPAIVRMVSDQRKDKGLPTIPYYLDSRYINDLVDRIKRPVD